MLEKIIGLFSRKKPEPEVPTLEEAVALFIQSRKDRGLRLSTMLNYKYALKLILKKWAGKKISELTREDIREIPPKGKTPTIHDRVFVVAVFVRWLYKKEWLATDITHNAFDISLSSRKARKKIKFLSPEAAHKYYASVPLEYRAAFALAIWAGIRPFEICRLKWGAIDFTDNSITIEPEVSKTWSRRRIDVERKRFWRMRIRGEEYLIPRDVRKGIPKILFDTLKPLAKGKDEYIFPADFKLDRDGMDLINRIVPHWVIIRQKIAKVSCVFLECPDIFRHTFLTFLVAYTQDLGVAALAAGHVDFKMLEKHYLGKVPPRDGERFFGEPITEQGPDIVDIPLPEDIRLALAQPANDDKTYLLPD